MKTTIDAAGRLVVPRAVRRAAGLEAGTVVDVRFVDGRIEIEPEAFPVTMERRGRFTVAVPMKDVTALTSSAVEETRDAILDDRLS